MYKIVIIKIFYDNEKILLQQKYLYLNDSNFLRYMKIFIIWFLHPIPLLKSDRQFVFKIFYIQNIVYYTLSD